MTTSNPSPRTENLPFRNRKLAESFGADAARYDRVRPGYPRDLADQVLTGLPGRRVLDVGIGTGLGSRPFRDAGAEILGVDADPRMAEFARTRGFEVDVARFENWDAAGKCFDAVIAAQAWHWIDPVAGAEKAADVLRPGGRLVLFWNFGDPEPAMAAAFAGVYRSMDTGLASIPWTTSALDSFPQLSAITTSGIDAADAFTDTTELRFPWVDTITRDSWLDQVPIQRGHDRIPADRLADLLAALGAVIDQHGGTFTMKYTTVAITTTKTPAIDGA